MRLIPRGISIGALLALLLVCWIPLCLTQEGAETFLLFAERALKGGLLVACAIIAWDTVVHAWRLVKQDRS